MAIRWQFLFAKLKNRLSLSDLHETTDQAFEIAATTSASDMFDALKRSEPRIDHGRMWRNEFSPKLEIIAAEQTRRSQAAECRRLIAKASEEFALATALVGVSRILCKRDFG